MLHLKDTSIVLLPVHIQCTQWRLASKVNHPCYLAACYIRKNLYCFHLEIHLYVLAACIRMLDSHLSEDEFLTVFDNCSCRQTDFKKVHV